jgi:hypothetical protein
MGTLSISRGARVKGFIFGVSSAAMLAGSVLSATPAAAANLSGSGNGNGANAAVAPATSSVMWDLTGTYTVVYTCTTGCAGSYPHTLNVTTMNTSTGAFSGNGFYSYNPAYSWIVTGQVTGSNVAFTTVYNNANAGYTMHATGTISASGSFSGTATASGQVFSWATTSGNANSFIGPPTSKEECWHGGWAAFNRPTFKNVGDCVSYVANGGKS